MGHRQNRNQIISLLRGQAACQAIAALAEAGIADQMLAGTFTVSDFAGVKRPEVLRALFTYLQSLDLLAPPDQFGGYTLTSSGRSVFKRAGGFLLLASYDPYFANLGNLLTVEDAAMPTVDRRRNVLGSGSLHSRKFFPCVWAMLEATPPAVLVDLGCGDGTFLELACREWPKVTAVASDMSPLAVNFAVERLKELNRPAGAGVVENACSVESWVSQIPGTLKAASPCVVSLWFVAHEFSGGNPETIVDFFRRLKLALPHADIVLAEIVAIPPEVLAKNYEGSIMPEFLFFHELSRQGVLSWDTWQTILKQIPYQLSGEHQFDLVDNSDGQTIPSSFLWHLTPA